MLRIYDPDKKKKIEQIMEEYAERISEEVIMKIGDAIERDKIKVSVVEISNPYETLPVVIHQEQYLTALVQNMKVLIRYEKYEVCAIAKKYIEILKEKRLLS